MKTKAIFPICVFTAVLFLQFLNPVCGYAAQTAPDPVLQHLELLEKQVNPERGLTWTFTPGENRSPRPYRIGRIISQQEISVQTLLNGQTVSCGVPVQNTPIVLHLKLYSKGLSEVRFMVNDKIVDTFTVDGSTGTGKEIEKRLTVTPSTRAKPYNIKLLVKNKGFKPFRTEFWPPRNKKLKERNTSFKIIEAAVRYPKAAENHKRLFQWLLSMKIGHALLYPDFVRYTFIGKPFKIEDKRQTPKTRLQELKKTLDMAVKSLTPQLLAAPQPGTVRSAIENSYKKAAPLNSFAKEFKVHLIGNAHIDIAWLWRMRETVLVAHNTYDTVLNNMEEYPELHYAQSQALTYQWMEKKYPELFQRIQQKVKDGKWEIVGGMWVEPDCNLISGESWVRQLLYGKRYFKEKFGLDIDTGWNPDSFGYNWNMPQIYSKSGIKRFITQKIWWNDTTVFPHFIFRWQGVDDTQLMTYFPPVGYTARVKMPKDIANITRYEATTGYKKTLLLYGLGNHGGGPNREILNRVRDYKNLYIAPEFIHSKSIDFLKDLENDLGQNIPVWKDELYLEYHRGTFTTQAKTKKNNRRCESLLSSAEKLATFAFVSGARKKYPDKDLEKAWKTVLTNQFHDILPGSSINPVYADADKDYKDAKKTIRDVIDDSLNKIAGDIDTSKARGKALVIFNPLPWKRTGMVSLDIRIAKGSTIVVSNSDGLNIPVEINRKKGKDKVYFIARNIPSLGYAVYSVEELTGSGKKRKKIEPGVLYAEIENRFYRIKVNKETGNIASIWDKKQGREFVAKGKEANVLQVYEDIPENWDAWNIGYTGRMWELNNAADVDVRESMVRKEIRVKKSFLGLEKSRYAPTEDFPSSFFEQSIVLYTGMDRIDIKTEADWWEEHMFLKAAFPVNVQNDVATYEIPFASIKRTTKSETLWEKARFEVPALRWADLSDKTGSAGISLLNDSKYGYDIHGNVMKISLLRSPNWPDPMADRGKHSFVYSLYTHPGDVTKGETVRRARELNNPLIPLMEKKHKGKLPPVFSFLSVKSGSVVLDTVKKAEDGKAMLVRLYESAGKPGTAEIEFFKAPTKATETDLMENKIKTLSTKGKTLSLTFKKFEIKTLKIKFN